MKSFFRPAFIVLLLCFLFAPGCTLNPVTGQKQITLIPRSDEIALGINAAPQFEKEFGGKVDNAQLQQYIRNVGAKLAAVSDRPMPYEYALLSSDIPNAFALPGGKIYVTVGLFKHMRNERQLAAVLAHETVHVAAQHSVQGMQRQMGASIFVDLIDILLVGGEGAETARAGSKIAASMATLHYGRDDESESDRYGLKYMQHAGYNPWGMVELLELLQSLSKSQPGLFGDLFASHPLTSTRINDVRGILPRSYPSYSGRTPDPHTKRFMQMRELLLSATKK